MNTTDQDAPIEIWSYEAKTLYEDWLDANYGDNTEEKLKHFDSHVCCGSMHAFMAGLARGSKELALKEAKQVIEKNKAYFSDRIPEHREYDMLDINDDWLEKWFK